MYVKKIATAEKNRSANVQPISNLKNKQLFFHIFVHLIELFSFFSSPILQLLLVFPASSVTYDKKNSYLRTCCLSMKLKAEYELK